jgi:hypothetical protein
MQNDCVRVDQSRLGKAGTGPPLEGQAPFCRVGPAPPTALPGRLREPLGDIPGDIPPFRPSVRSMSGCREARRNVKGEKGK